MANDEHKSHVWRTGKSGGGSWEWSGVAKVSCAEWPRTLLKSPVLSGARIDLEVTAGSGVSHIVVGLTPAIFEELARAMLEADRDTALLAFARATARVLEDAS